MIKERVHFFNNVLDDYGMPTNFRSYYIVSRNAEMGESANQSDGRAKVYTLSTQAVVLNPEYVVAQGGAENAANLAIEKLKSLNLSMNIKIFESD